MEMRYLAVGFRLLIVIVVIGGMVIGGRVLVKNKKNALANAPKYGEKPVVVHVVKARKGSLSESRTYLAVYEPIQKATVSARITAVIDKVFCNEGITVEAGQILVKLDCRETKEKIAAAKAGIERAISDISSNEAIVKSLKKSVAFWELEAKRDETLAKQNNIPKSQAEGTAEKANDYKGRYFSAQQKSRGLRHQVDSLKRQLEQLQVQLTYGTINSPYKGMVSRRLVDPGDLAAPGKPLIIVEDRSEMMLVFNIPQEDLTEIKEGLALRFKINGDKHKGTLTRLYPSLDENRTLRAECILQEKELNGLTSGSYVPISIVVSELNDVVLVPASSLIEAPDGKTYVFTVSEDKLEPKIVTVTGKGADNVSVTGLNVGEIVVSSTFLGWVKLASGMKVEPVQ